jgi:hypothetical protein
MSYDEPRLVWTNHESAHHTLVNAVFGCLEQFATICRIVELKEKKVEFWSNDSTFENSVPSYFLVPLSNG